MKRYSISGLCVVLFFCLNQFLFSQNVIIVVVDGARYSETFGAGDTYIPHLYNDLKPLGTLYTNFRIDYPSGNTETCSGHSTIVSGTWQNIDEEGNQRPTRPTVFEYLRKEDGNPDSDCYAVTGKDKLDILTYSSYSDYGLDYGGIWVGDDDRDDDVTYPKVISVMQDYHPKILVINFAEVDYKAHYFSWDEYLTALSDVDSYIYELWQHIENGDWGYTPQNTTIFITNDHGRHDDQHGGYEDHGDGCDGCTHIMLLALGRNIPAGVTVDETKWQRDIAPTVGELLDFQTPLSTGTSLLEQPTNISSEGNSSLPSGFVLDQNYPNPFNPSTKISWQSQVSSWQTLKVFDILGNEIVTLVDEYKPAGTYEVVFNAVSHSGESVDEGQNLPSGMYFYTLKAGSFTETKKMILLK
jgi:hypothetical protein